MIFFFKIRKRERIYWLLCFLLLQICARYPEYFTPCFMVVRSWYLVSWLCYPWVTVSACYPGHVVLTVIFGLQGATFPPNFDSCILRAACAYYMDELRYVSCDFVSAKSTVDINPCGPILPNITSMLMFGLDNLRTPLRSAHSQLCSLEGPS